MVEDISRNTIVVLVALTLIVSMVGTWAVLDEMSRVQPQYVVEPVTDANIKLSIVPEGEYVDENPQFNAETAAAITVVEQEE